jgi:hypothetical protein
MSTKAASRTRRSSAASDSTIAESTDGIHWSYVCKYDSEWQDDRRQVTADALMYAARRSPPRSRARSHARRICLAREVAMLRESSDECLQRCVAVTAVELQQTHIRLARRQRGRSLPKPASAHPGFGNCIAELGRLRGVERKCGGKLLRPHQLRGRKIRNGCGPGLAGRTTRCRASDNSLCSARTRENAVDGCRARMTLRRMRTKVPHGPVRRVQLSRFAHRARADRRAELQRLQRCRFRQPVPIPGCAARRSILISIRWPSAHDVAESAGEPLHTSTLNSLLVIYAALFAGGVTVEAAAQSASSAIPDNARQRSYGGGWECKRGYRETAGRCDKVIVPANAYLSSEGSSWICNRGFLTDGARCTAVQIPLNGHAVDTRYDKGWRCNRGYRPVGETCVRLSIPAHAYAIDSNYGTGWKCERGFREAEGGCVALVVPANGYLVQAGDEWKCERGFRRFGDSCDAVAVPANAYLDDLGSDWRCDRGFRRMSGGCVALRVPEHGYISHSGDDWSCEDSFRKNGDTCQASGAASNRL